MLAVVHHGPEFLRLNCVKRGGKCSPYKTMISNTLHLVQHIPFDRSGLHEKMARPNNDG